MSDIVIIIRYHEYLKKYLYDLMCNGDFPELNSFGTVSSASGIISEIIVKKLMIPKLGPLIESTTFC